MFLKKFNYRSEDVVTASFLQVSARNTRLLTPWKGEYDYNCWSVDTVRYGCTVPAGIYIGVQGDSNNANTIPGDAEQILLDKGYDNDACLNGEAQMLLHKF